MKPFLIILPTLLILFIGCSGNGFTVDEKKKTLNMSSVHFHISGQEGTASFYLKPNISGWSMPKQVFLLENNPDYNVELQGYNGNICCKLNDSVFIFKPIINQVYIITNTSNGDATDYSVKVIFDSLYNVHLVNNNKNSRVE